MLALLPVLATTVSPTATPVVGCSATAWLPPPPPPPDAYPRRLPTALLPSLVPGELSTAPHYYTTWGTQGYMAGDCRRNLTIDYIFNSQFSEQQQSLCSDYLFGKPNLPGSGWLDAFYPQSRGELFFLLDQGYATGDDMIEPSPARFPQWNQSDPGQRLAAFQNAVKEKGWRGLGLWNRMSSPDYAVKAANWSKHAGITYWKIDGPDTDCKCSDAAKAVFPELIIEHGFCPVTGCPLNDPYGGKVYPPSSAQEVMQTLGCSDVFRSYDTVPTLSTPTTLSRLSTILNVAKVSLPKGGNDAMLNGDAESLVSNALGCAIGVMRAPVSGLRPPIKDTGMSEPRDVDLFFMGNRQAKQRLDEVDRIVRWSRIAPPFGARAEGGADITMDQTLLCDAWTFEPGDTWDKDTWGKTLEQCAPARVTRGLLPLPTVVPLAGAADSVPFVVSTRYPGAHAVSITTLARTAPRPVGYHTPLVNVTQQTLLGVADARDGRLPLVGVFGSFGNLVLGFASATASRIVGVIAQDLRGEVSMDVTKQVAIDAAADTVTVSGTLIAEVGTSAATVGDLSEPGLVLAFVLRRPNVVV